MKKILIAANLDLFFAKFLFPHLKYLKEQGYEVHIACKNTGIEIPYCDKQFDVSFARGLNIKDNIQSYRQMKQIFKSNHYDVIHCHTPFGAAITRLAHHRTHSKGKMIYTAHGFHFFKGASWKNWLLFYPVEKWLAHYTDILITINEEDYQISKSKFKTNTRYIHGIGLDQNKFKKKISEKEKNTLRESLHLNDNDFVMIFVAELTNEKGQLWLLSALQPLLKKYPNMKLLLPGNDSLNGACQALSKELQIDKQVQFLGFRKDIPQLLQISDISLSSSYREGLPVNLMEAMYYYLPIVATDCRGNRDFVKEGVNGFIISNHDSAIFCQKVEQCYQGIDKEQVKKYDQEYIQQYLLDNVLKEMNCIYREIEAQHD